mgnify:CR=1 FL=1
MRIIGGIHKGYKLNQPKLEPTRPTTDLAKEALFNIITEDIPEEKECSCPEVLRAEISPRECPLFGNICTPQNPKGPCMVSREGACYISFKYEKSFR